MREELQYHKLMIGFIIVWITIFLCLIVGFGVHKAEAKLEAGMVLLLTSIVGAALAYVGMGGIMAASMFGIKHRKDFVSYIVLGTLALVIAAILMFSSDQSISVISLGAAPFPLLLGLAEIRLSLGCSRHPRLGSALIICAALELTSGVLLLAARFLDDSQVMNIIAATAFISLVQLMPFLMFKRSDIRRISSRSGSRFHRLHS